MKKLLAFLLLPFAVCFLSLTLQAQTPRTMNAAEIKLALNKLGKLCSVLYVGAHPDDENTAVLAYLANEMQCRTAYLSLTRGEGGQNLIGTERGAALGVIRTQELLAARRIDGAEQMFTRAIDFGFSKTAEESLRLWNKQEVLADVVWAIRKFRPDVVITRFPPDERAGHGHHIASAILAAEAFKIAGDKTKFPEQLKYVAEWQPKRLVWNSFVRQGDTPPTDALKYDVGKFNPLLGKSYTEIAAESRTMHKSQGQGTAAVRGERIEYFTHVDGEKATKDLLDGVETSWKRVEGEEIANKTIAEIQTQFKPENPSAIFSKLAQTAEDTLSLRIKAVERRIALEKRSQPIPQNLLTQIHYLFNKEAELSELIRAASGLWLEAVAAQPTVTTGERIEIKYSAVNRTALPLKLLEAGSIFGSTENLNANLNPNQLFSTKIPASIAVKETAQPYWLELPNNGYLAKLEENYFLEEPENVYLLSEQARIETNGKVYEFNTPIFYRFVDRVNGEIYRQIIVAPDAVINLAEPLQVFPTTNAKKIRLTVRNNRNALNGVVKLDLPAGWQAEPREIPVNFTEKGAEANVTFTITPTASAKDGNLTAFVEANGQRYDKQQITIDYPHIPQQTLFPEATAKLVKLDIKTGRERIGYIMGSGDEIPNALLQLGYNVKLLSDEDLQTTDLNANFDTIIAGIRAYNTREVLKKQNARVLDFVKNGGKLVVQYNVNDNTLLQNFAPFPLKLSNERVTVEDAPVKFLQPDASVLNFPNKITPSDFTGWTQERGTYFAGEFDANNFTPILEMHDPNEPDRKGSLLVARHGKGEFIYTGIAFFRQLPAGNAGAYRLFVNLISNQ